MDNDDPLPIFDVVLVVLLLLKLELNGLLKLLRGLADGVKQAGGASYSSLCVNCNLPILMGDKGVESIIYIDIYIDIYTG